MIKKTLLVLVFLVVGIALNAYGAARAVPLEGYNWYSEKEENKKKTEEAIETKSDKEDLKELPQHEKNIRDLQARHEKAHRMALDNPTAENLLNELKLEREMMKKSEIYGQRRVAVAMLDSQFTDMKNHSNVLHRRVQDQVNSAQDREKLIKLSKNWGLVLQVQEGCPHCHAFAPIVLEFASKHNFELIAATEDGSDFEGIEGAMDAGQMLVFNPKRETPMLYLVKDDGTEVLPISRGINSEDQIINNIMTIDKHLRRLF